VPNVETLKRNLINALDEISAEDVSAVTDSTASRFRAVVAARGGYFEE